MDRPERGAGAAVVAVLMLLAGGAVVGGGAPARAQGGLDGLLAKFRAMPGLEARFHEEKHIALLAAPLESDGVLRFAPPAHLLRRVTSPSPSTLLVDGDTLRIREGDETRSLDLSASPPVRAFVESFRALLAGDRAALEAHFRLRFEPGEGEAWRLTMRPRDRSLARAVERIAVEGRGVVLERLVVSEASGDRSVTTFRAVDAQRRYTKAELERLFRLR